MMFAQDGNKIFQRIFDPFVLGIGFVIQYKSPRILHLGDKLCHLHFHLAPKYVGGPDYGGTFQMNPGKVYLSDEEYAQLIEAVRSCL